MRLKISNCREFYRISRTRPETVGCGITSLANQPIEARVFSGYTGHAETMHVCYSKRNIFTDFKHECQWWLLCKLGGIEVAKGWFKVLNVFKCQLIVTDTWTVGYLMFLYQLIHQQMQVTRDNLLREREGKSILLSKTNRSPYFWMQWSMSSFEICLFRFTDYYFYVLVWTTDSQTATDSNIFVYKNLIRWIMCSSIWTSRCLVAYMSLFCQV